MPPHHAPGALDFSAEGGYLSYTPWFSAAELEARYGAWGATDAVRDNAELQVVRKLVDG